MCFSARVQQKLEHLSRRYGAEVAWEEFERLFEARLEGADVKVARQLERNFSAPSTDVQRRTKAAIDHYNAELLQKWETEVFTQRRRLAEAEETLAVKPTKKASEDKRIATDKIATLLRRICDQRSSAPDPNEGRIFPMMYAPIIAQIDGKTVIRPMRYTCRLRDKPASYDQRYPGTYNARRDSLAGFWKPLYARQHGVMVITGFFENVQRHNYEHRALAPGEKPSNLVLQFTPQPETEMLVACLWDRWLGPQPSDELYSFAAITDEPPEEILSTGHERCVISLRENNLAEWLAPQQLSPARLDEILSEKEPLYYQHALAA